MTGTAAAHDEAPLRTRTSPRAAPLDLRLLPPALAAWLVCLLGVRVGAWASAAAACVLLVAAVGGRLWARERDRRGPGRPRPGRGRGRHGSSPGAPVATSVLLTLLVSGATALVVAVHVDLRAEALAALPTQGSMTATLRIDADPRPGSVPAWGGEPSLVVRAQLLAVSTRGRSEAVRVPVTVIAPPSWADLAIGERIETRVRVRPTEPGDASAAMLLASAPPTRLAPPPAHLRVAGLLRSTLRATTADLPAHARALVPGIAVGDDRALDPELEEDLRATGLTHLTAVSGAHVALLLAPVLLLTGAVRPGVRVGLSLAVLLALVLLVRPEPSVIRAAAMGTVTILALLAGRPAAVPSSLSAGVLVLLLGDPWLAGSYGFVLSVLATGALALLAPAWTRGLSSVLPTPLAAGIATTAAAQTVCAPVLVLLSPQISLAAIPANLVAAPAVAPVTFLGLGATLAGPWAPGLAHAAAEGAAVGTWWIAGVATVAAGLPASTLPWPEGPPGALALAAVSVVLVVAAPVVGRWAIAWAASWSERAAATVDRATTGDECGSPVRWRAVAVATLVACAITAAVWVPIRGLEGGGATRTADLVQCDVGQGSATLLRTGPGSAVVVDVGPRPEGARGIGRCLRDAGVRRIDLLVLTHTHADHADGLTEALGVARVEAAVVGPGPNRSSIAAALEAQGGELMGASAGTRLSAGEDPVRLDVLQGVASSSGGPEEDETDEGVNARSLVVLATLPGGTRVFLGGDIGEVDQDRLVATARTGEGGDPGDRRAVPAARGLLDGVDVVLVPHHGSADQSPRLATVLAPRLAIIGVGENDYGHPTRAALAMYSAAQERRTDECGDIAVVEEDGPRLRVVDRCG